MSDLRRYDSLMNLNQVRVGPIIHENLSILQPLSGDDVNRSRFIPFDEPWSFDTCTRKLLSGKMFRYVVHVLASHRLRSMTAIRVLKTAIRTSTRVATGGNRP
jgi:hypothetical protein